MKNWIELVGLVLELGARVEQLEETVRKRNGSKYFLTVKAKQIVDRVAAFGDVSVADMRSDWREQRVVHLRWQTAALLKAAGFGHRATAGALGWTKPSAAHYALKRHGECMETDTLYAEAFEKLRKALA